MKTKARLASSLAVQDQEWEQAKTWFRDPDNAVAAAKLTMASVAEDANDLTRLMQHDERYADIVQRMVALVIVEVLHKHVDEVSDTAQED